MSHELADGTIITDGRKVTPRSNPTGSTRYIPHPVIGQITAAYPTDDPNNADGETVLLDIFVSDLNINLYRVPHTLDKAGVDNYVYYAPNAPDANVDGTPFNKGFLDPSVSNGDTVLLLFAYGDVHRPYVVKVIPHNQSGDGGLSPDPRPTSSDGDCFKIRMNGTSLFFDQDGNVSLKTGPTLDDIKEGSEFGTSKTLTIDFGNGDGDSTTVTLDGETGNLTYQGADDGISVTIDNENDEIDLKTAFGDELSISAQDGIQASTPASGGTSISMKNGQVDVEGAQGVSVTSSQGDVDVTTDSGDVSVTTKAGNVAVSSTAGDVTLTAAGGAQLNLSKGMVALGNKTAELLDIINSLLQALQTCTAPGFGAPISIVAQIPPLVVKLTAIKGSLS